MAREHTIECNATSSGAPEAVWALLADTAGWSRWSDIDEARRIADGSPHPEGVGAERLFLTGRVRNQEEVVRFEPPRVLGYRVVGGNVPVRDYRSEVTLTEDAAGGTEIHWRSAFKAKWPGTGGLVARSLGGFIQKTADQLARAAEQPPPAS